MNAKSAAPSPNLDTAADLLWQARSNRSPIQTLRDVLAPDDLEGAYSIQSMNVARALRTGRTRVGRKIGLTSSAVQAQLGVNQPDFGVLLDDMLIKGTSARIGYASFLQPKIEGEMAFTIAADIDEPGLPSAELVRRAGRVSPAFEIVDSAIADWKITLADTVADNASCGAMVLSNESRSLEGFERRLTGMVLSVDGTSASLGVGAASLGDPLSAFAWLADKAVEQGDPLRAGEVVLTGALGPMIPMAKGRTYRLELAGFRAIELQVD